MKEMPNIVIAGLLLIAAPVYAAPSIKIMVGPETLIGGVPQCDDHAYYDTYTLTVKDGTNVLARYQFCSSGRPNADAVVDAVGSNFIFLKYEDGNGTYASAKLRIFELPRERKNLGRYWGTTAFPFPGLTEYLTVPIFASSGPHSDWEYKYKIEKPRCGGLRLIFTRVVEGGGEIYSIPGQETRVIDIGIPLKCSR